MINEGYKLEHRINELNKKLSLKKYIEPIKYTGWLRMLRIKLEFFVNYGTEI